MATGSNIVVLRPLLKMVAEGRNLAEEMVDVDEEVEAGRQASDTTMADTETATRTTTDTETETEMGALANNDYSDPAPLHQVI